MAHVTGKNVYWSNITMTFVGNKILFNKPIVRVWSKSEWSYLRYALSLEGLKLLPSQLLTEQTTILVVPGALAHHLQCLQNPKWPLGGPKMADGSTPRFLGTPVNFR